MSAIKIIYEIDFLQLYTRTEIEDFKNQEPTTNFITTLHCVALMIVIVENVLLIISKTKNTENVKVIRLCFCNTSSIVRETHAMCNVMRVMNAYKTKATQQNGQKTKKELSHTTNLNGNAILINSTARITS